MRRGAGFLALFTVLMTGIHMGNGPAPSRPGVAVAATGESSVAPGTPQRVDTTCSAFGNPASQQSKAGNPDVDPAEAGEISTLTDRFLYGSAMRSHLTPGTLPKGMRILIVTLPDPLHTHLSLQFDRTLEALQQAAQDEHYTYDSSWLPWQLKTQEFSSMADRNAQAKQTAQREACPGLILFRKNMSALRPDNCPGEPTGALRSGDMPFGCGMLVFVVGETPTVGLNRVQWDNALRWVEQYASKDRPDRVLRVMGPTFSGSVPSFARALEDVHEHAAVFDSALLYTGRIRGCGSWLWLKSKLNPTGKTATPANPTFPVRIADFEENDSIESDRLYQYLLDRGHRLSEVAVISEDETAYGGLPDARSAGAETPGTAPSPCSAAYPYSDRPVHLYYPRDISAIRSAYQEQSIFSSGSRTEASATERTVLRPEGGTPAQGATDTVEPFSGTNLALTQEAQLYGIVNTLKTHGIRFVVLRSTNSLDYLFLTRFMHRAYPTAYIVTTGSDLLFGREVDSTEFRGVMALSTFPLLPRGQDWTKQTEAIGQHAHRVFGSYTMEGAYLAARFVMTDPPPTAIEIASQIPFVHPAKPDIPDYALPFWSRSGEMDEVPATWLAVVGRDGYWPLATLTRGSLHPPRFSSVAHVEKSREPAPNKDEGKPPTERLSLSGSWRFTCVLAFALLGMHFFACRFGWSREDLGMFVQFTPLRDPRAPALIAFGWATICSILLLLFLTSFRIFWWMGLADRVWVLVTGAAGVIACVMAIQEVKWWRVLPASVSADAQTQKAGEADRARFDFPAKWIGLMFVAVGAIVVAGLFSFDYFGSTDSAVATAYRSVHMACGVSPLLSIVLMLAGFYWWFWQSLSGLALLGEGRPVLPQTAFIPAGLSQVSDKLANRIEAMARPFPSLNRRTTLFYLVPLLLVLLLAFVLQRAWTESFDLILHSLEGAAFNRTFHIFIGAALYLILLDCAQLYLTWLALKRLLMALNRLPLRRTFAALQGLSMRSLWSMSGTSSRARYKIFAGQLEALLHLRNELDAFEWRQFGSSALRDSVHAAWAQGWDFVNERNSISESDVAMLNTDSARSARLRLCVCAEDILRELIGPAWLEERKSLEVRPVPAEGDANQQLALSTVMPVRLAEEFVCLAYVGYVQNLLGRMRTMVFAIAGVFAAIALSVGLYPFTPRPTISLSLMTLLILIGVLVSLVYAGLERDATLSHITNTQPGALSAHFWVRIVSFVGVPALGLIVAQFPEITDFAFSWIEPTMNAVK